MKTHEPNPDSREPLLSRATLTAVATAALTLLVSFGLPITEAQQAAILGFIAVAGPLGLAWWARRHTWSGRAVADAAKRR